MAMLHYIDPTVDCVFKAILGALGREHLLVDFLNCVIQPVSSIVEVMLLNPYNDRDVIGGKLSVVDIKARDSLGNIYQIEVQLSSPGYLPNRILHNWSSIYQGQMNEGDRWAKLKPVISIWLLTENVIMNDDTYHHHFQVWDNQHQQLLSNHCSIHVLELKKWQQSKTLLAHDYWLYFFKEAKHWKSLPKCLHNLSMMRQAMKVLEAFSQREKDYHEYQARQNFIRDRDSDKAEREEAQAEVLKEKALREKAEALREKAEAELAQLKTLLGKI
jgi:predicted transposase/invertase (TIGR01784 family)